MKRTIIKALEDEDIEAIITTDGMRYEREALTAQVRAAYEAAKLGIRWKRTPKRKIVCVDTVVKPRKRR